MRDRVPHLRRGRRRIYGHRSGRGAGFCRNKHQGGLFMHLIPQSWAHLHILVSVFPSFGLVIVLGFYFAGYLADNNGVRRTCLVLFVLLALLSIPTFLSGQCSMAALSDDPKI